MPLNKVGRQDVRRDEKGRIIIPSNLFDELTESCVDDKYPMEKGAFYVMVSMGPDGNLHIYPPSEYDKLEEDLDNKVKQNRYDADWVDIASYVEGNSYSYKVDKSRRVRLTDEICELAGIKKEVSILKHGNNLILHDKNDYVKEHSAKIKTLMRSKSGDITRNGSSPPIAEKE